MNRAYSPSDTLYCHICGEPLVGGGIGYSVFELRCDTCQAAYHVQGDEASYVTPSFVEKGEAPVVVPIAHLRSPDHVRHLEHE